MLKGAGRLLLGLALGWGSQQLERAGDVAALAPLAADNAELRKTAKTLRRVCPRRPRVQREAYRPGDLI